MSAITDHDLWLHRRVKPGKNVASDVIDVSNASAVNLLIQVTGRGKKLRKKMVWRVMFGPIGGAGFVTCREGTFEVNPVAVAVPVFRPQLLVTVDNGSTIATHVDGSVRIVHETCCPS